MNCTSTASILSQILLSAENVALQSTRSNKWLFLKRHDDNIFTPAASNYILQSIKPLLSTSNQLLVGFITEISTQNYPLYKNKRGRLSYNFWATNRPNSHFSNGNILNRFKFFALPDDVDTTAMVLLTSGYAVDEVAQLKALLPYHANTTRLTVKTSLPQFTQLKCYSTWLGEKMPIELDCCVLANLMLLIFDSQLPLTNHDNAVIEFLSAIILNDYYTTHTFQIALQYPRKAVVLYHLARLITKFSHHFSPEVAAKLKIDIQQTFESTSLPFERLILQTSLLRFNPIETHNLIDIKPIDVKNYWWFTAGFLSGYSNPMVKKLAPFSLFHLRFSSQLLNFTLLLENRVLLKQHLTEKNVVH